MAAVAVGAVFAPVLALSRVPQFPVQLARATGVVVVPTVTFPPAVGEAATFSVHCLWVKFAVNVKSVVGVIFPSPDASQLACCPDAPSVGCQIEKQ